MTTTKSSADGSTRSIVLIVLPGLLAATLIACGGGGDHGTGGSGTSSGGSSSSGPSSSSTSSSSTSSGGSSSGGPSSSGPSSSGTSSSGSACSGPTLTADQQGAVDAVNAARQEVNANYLYPHVHWDADSSMWVPVASLEMACWDPDIAADAQASAEAVLAMDGCAFMDGADPKGYGQNIAVNDDPPGSMGATSPFTVATQSFIAEKAHYNYKWTGPFTASFQRYNPMIPMPYDAQSVDSVANDPSLPENEGYTIGHYTPIIWAKMTAFGCGFATAMKTDSSGQTSPCNQYVCFYGPARADNKGWINLEGDPPY